MDSVCLLQNIKSTLSQNESVYFFFPTLHQLISNDWILGILPVALWVILVIYGTLKSNSLSIYRSYKELTTSRNSQLDSLDIFRVVAILWVIVNHTGSEGRVDVLDRLPSANQFKESVHKNPIVGALLGNSALGVEIFLVLSGFLGGRSWLKRADQPFFAHYRAFIIRRVLRLTPSVIFFIYIATSSLSKHLLPRFHSSMISSCSMSSIASHLMFLGNWQSTPTCLGYLWYLGLDFQLYMLAPFLLYSLYEWPLFGKILCAFLIIASMILRAGYCTVYNICHKSDVDIPFIAFPGQEESDIREIYAGIWEMYARPYTKCGPFVLGLLLGTATISMKPFLTVRTSRLIASTFFALCISVVYAILPQYWYGNYFKQYNMYYTASFRTIFAIGICGMILAIISQQTSKSTSFMWSLLARLTYNTYLLHMPVIYLFNYSQFLQQAKTASELMMVVPFVAILCFIVSSIFYIFVEAPLGRLTSSWADQIEAVLVSSIGSLRYFIISVPIRRLLKYYACTGL